MIDGKQPKQYTSEAYFQDFEIGGNGDGITIRAGALSLAMGRETANAKSNTALLSKPLLIRIRKTSKKRAIWLMTSKSLRTALSAQLPLHP